MNIDEFLNEKGFKKTPLNKFHQPDPEFWEDYVYFTKTIGSIIKKHLMLRSAGKNSLSNWFSSFQYNY